MKRGSAGGENGVVVARQAVQQPLEVPGVGLLDGRGRLKARDRNLLRGQIAGAGGTAREMRFDTPAHRFCQFFIDIVSEQLSDIFALHRPTPALRATPMTSLLLATAF